MNCCENRLISAFRRTINFGEFLYYLTSKICNGLINLCRVSNYCYKISVVYRYRVISFLQYRHCRSEEHTSELQSLMRISYAVFCLKKKNYDSSLIYNSASHTTP